MLHRLNVLLYVSYEQVRISFDTMKDIYAYGGKTP